MPGVLAAGDVRHGSVKRVASAVGEGSVAIQQLTLVGRVEEVAAQVHQNLEALELHRKREILRALVRRVESGLDQVQVVFRVDAFAGEADPGKKSLQLCKRSS